MPVELTYQQIVNLVTENTLYPYSRSFINELLLYLNFIATRMRNKTIQQINELAAVYGSIANPISPSLALKNLMISLIIYISRNAQPIGNVLTDESLRILVDTM
jgi:hypothetical protein